MNKEATTPQEDPSIMKWALRFSASAGIAGILCCVAPAVLFMFGLMGGVYAISFADFFYAEDGAIGLGSWLLRGLAVVIGLFGVYLFKKKQNQCSMNPKRKKKNLILMAIVTLVLGVGVFLSLEKLSSWYFNKHIVPAQQEEFRTMDQNKK
jgi:H+/Cl- antiporter ClcA